MPVSPEMDQLHRERTLRLLTEVGAAPTTAFIGASRDPRLFASDALLAAYQVVLLKDLLLTLDALEGGR